MFNNIGRKIKNLAEIICCLGIVASIYLGLQAKAVSTSILIIIAGGLGSWLGSFVLYGFGELVDKVCDIEAQLDNIRRNVSKVTDSIQPDNPPIEE